MLIENKCITQCVIKNFRPTKEKQVTVYNVGSSPAATLNSTNFGRIDFFFVEREWWHQILSVAPCMDMSLAAHHFPVIAEIDVELPKAIATTARDPRYHLSELQCAYTSSLFATSFHECILQCHCEHGTADELCTAMATSFQQSALSVVCINPNDGCG